MYDIDHMYAQQIASEGDPCSYEATKTVAKSSEIMRFQQDPTEASEFFWAFFATASQMRGSLSLVKVMLSANKQTKQLTKHSNVEIGFFPLL